MKCIELLFSGEGRFHGRDWWVKWLTLPKCIPTFCFVLFSLHILNYVCFSLCVICVLCAGACVCVSVCVWLSKSGCGGCSRADHYGSREWVGLHCIAGPTLELISSLPDNEWSKLGQQQLSLLMFQSLLRQIWRKKAPSKVQWQKVVEYFRLFVM